MYDSSGSQFFRAATGTKSVPDSFDESMFVRTFLTILEVTEILCNFRLVLKGKAGKEISESSRLELSGIFLANNFALSDAENNTTELLNGGAVTDLPLLRIQLAIRQMSHEPRF